MPDSTRTTDAVDIWTPTDDPVVIEAVVSITPMVLPAVRDAVRVVPAVSEAVRVEPAAKETVEFPLMGIVPAALVSI